MIAITAERQPAPASETDCVWEDRARLLRVIAHPARLTILELLCARPRCVGEINSRIPLAQSHLSQHMAALRKAQLVACHACGTKRCYYIIRPTLIKKLISLLRQPHLVEERDCRSILRQARRARKLAAAHSDGNERS